MGSSRSIWLTSLSAEGTAEIWIGICLRPDRALDPAPRREPAAGYSARIQSAAVFRTTGASVTSICPYSPHQTRARLLEDRADFLSQLEDLVVLHIELCPELLDCLYEHRGEPAVVHRLVACEVRGDSFREHLLHLLGDDADLSAAI